MRPCTLHLLVDVVSFVLVQIRPQGYSLGHRCFRLVELQVCQGLIQEKNIVVGIGVEKAWVLLGMTWECFVGKPKRAQRLLLLSKGGLSRSQPGVDTPS